MNTESNNYDGWWTRDQGKDILTKRDTNLIKSNKKKEFGIHKVKRQLIKQWEKHII